MFMKHELTSHFGSDFPVGSGSTTYDDPLVITERIDYVSIEYEISRYLLDGMGLEYKFEKQSCRTVDGRVIDELAYATRKSSDPDHARTMRFYFDITSGFNRRPSSSLPDKSIESLSIPQEPKVSDFSQQEFESLVRSIVTRFPNNKDGVELRNWIKLGKLILTFNPARIGRPEVGKLWEVQHNEDGTFKNVAFYLKGIEPKDGTKILIKEVLPVIRRNVGSPEQFLNGEAPSQAATVTQNRVQLDERSAKIVQLWFMAAKSGKIPPEDIASAVYFGVTDSPPPAEVHGITRAMDLLEYFKKQETGRGFDPEERREILAGIVDMTQSEQIPSTTTFRVLTWLPNIALILAIVAVIVGPFSWIVSGLAVIGKIENGFAKFLAGRGHQAAGLHIGIALAAMLSSLVASLLHIFSVYRFA